MMTCFLLMLEMNFIGVGLGPCTGLTDSPGKASMVLRTISKSGRPTKIPKEVAVRIRKELLGSKHGWTTKQVRDVIFREGGVRYHYTHVYRILHKWGFKQKVPRKVHINTASGKEKEDFKKEPREYWTL